MRIIYFCIAIPIITSSCSTLSNTHKYELSSGAYKSRQDGTKYQKTNVYVTDEGIGIYSYAQPSIPVHYDSLSRQMFLKKSFDVDVIIVPFKIRPTTANLPRQLTTDFNGNIFLGYRLDKFIYKPNPTPMGIEKRYLHRAVTFGVFGGLGASDVTPWTTNNQTTDEYHGLVLTRGLATMIGVNNLTVGAGMGWDFLTDGDGDIWIYQNKPWFGLTLGLNIN